MNYSKIYDIVTSSQYITGNEFKQLQIKYPKSKFLNGKKKITPDEALQYYIDEKIDQLFFSDVQSYPKNIKILDLGTGTGYFPLICKLLGYDCTGLEAGGSISTGKKYIGKHLYKINDEAPHNQWGLESYNDCVELFKIPMIYQWIQPKVPLKLNQKYTVITAGRMIFDRHPEWDWKFFLNDISQYLSDDGVIMFHIQNENPPYLSKFLQKYKSRKYLKITKKQLNELLKKT